LPTYFNRGHDIVFRQAAKKQALHGFALAALTEQR